MKASIVTERGDALIATAARASFNRRADQYTDEQNEGLQRYLVRPAIPHFAPFCHVRLTLRLQHWMIIYKRLDAYNKTGMIDIRHPDGIVDVSHSLWGWYLLLRDKKVHYSIADSIIDHLHAIAPVASKVLDIDRYRAKDMHESGYVQVIRAPVSYENDFVTLRVECPIVIARQLMKSQVGFMHSEASGRYILYDKQYLPTAWHVKPDDKKQGAGKQVGIIRKVIAVALTKLCHAVSYASYTIMHKVLNIAAEEARYCLSMAAKTTIVITAARADWDRVIELRSDKTAQTDIRVLTELIEEELNK